MIAARRVQGRRGSAWDLELGSHAREHPALVGSFRDALFAEMGDPKTDGERLRRISALFNAARIKAPLMVLQGANGPRVHQVESDGRNRRGREEEWRAGRVHRLF